MVAAVYRPPSANSDFFDKFDKTLATASMENKECIFLGDFNCNFTEGMTNFNTDNLKFYTNTYGFIQMIDSPTRVTSQSQSLIDVIFVSTPDVFIENGVFCTSISDHFLTYSVRCFNCKLSTQQGHKYMESRPFSKLNEQDFINDLINVPWNVIDCVNDIELAWQTWSSLFMDVVNLHVPLCKKKIRHNACPWITDDIVKLMKERDQIHKAAVKYNRQKLWNDYRCSRNKVTHMMQKQKSNHYCGLIRDNAGNSRKIWSYLKEITPKQSRVLPSSVEVNGSDCSAADQIADAFNDYFVNCAKKVTEHLPAIAPNVYPMDADHALEDTSVFNLTPVSPAFVKKTITNMNANKSTGDDQISCRLLKIAMPAILHPLTKIINLCLIYGYVPGGMKSAKVIPLFKSGETSDVGNYRPISILPSVSKILERAVCDQLSQFINEHELMHPNQS